MPKVITSSSNTLRIWFYSDKSEAYQGFNGSYISQWEKGKLVFEYVCMVYFIDGLFFFSSLELTCTIFFSFKQGVVVH